MSERPDRLDDLLHAGLLTATHLQPGDLVRHLRGLRVSLSAGAALWVRREDGDPAWGVAIVVEADGDLSIVEAFADDDEATVLCLGEDTIALLERAIAESKLRRASLRNDAAPS